MKRIALTSAVKDVLKPAMWGNAEKQVFAEIEQGRSGLYITSRENMLVVLRPEAETLVVVAVAGRDLRGNRQELINFARANGFVRARFHTRNPEHLKKGLLGLSLGLQSVNKRRFGRDEYVYTLELL